MSGNKSIVPMRGLGKIINCLDEQRPDLVFRNDFESFQTYSFISDERLFKGTIKENFEDKINRKSEEMPFKIVEGNIILLSGNFYHEIITSTENGLEYWLNTLEKTAQFRPANVLTYRQGDKILFLTNPDKRNFYLVNVPSESESYNRTLEVVNASSISLRNVDYKIASSWPRPIEDPLIMRC